MSTEQEVEKSERDAHNRNSQDFKETPKEALKDNELNASELWKKYQKKQNIAKAPAQLALYAAASIALFVLALALFIVLM